MSRFEAGLLDAIRGENGEAKKSVLRLVWAAYRARLGDILTAREVAAQVRATYEKRHQAQIFAHINFVEGLCEYFDGGIPAALPKLLRSRAMCAGCPASDDLPVLVSAWLAAIYRNLGKWSEMAAELMTAIGLKDHFSDEALCRVGLVAADAFQEVERYGDAAKWYSFVHSRALSVGDDAALSAMLYNRAAIRLFNLRIAEVRDGQADISGVRVDLEAASARNYTLYIRDGSMSWGFDLMGGQLHLLKGEYKEALELLNSSKIQGLRAQWPAVDALRQADVFRCNAMLGEVEKEKVAATADALAEAIGALPGAGDRAVAFNSLAIGSDPYGLAACVRYRELSRLSLDGHLGERAKEANELMRFVSASEAVLRI